MTLLVVFSTQLQCISFYTHSKEDTPHGEAQHVDLCLIQRRTVPTPDLYPPKPQHPLFTAKDASLFYVATFAHQVMDVLFLVKACPAVRNRNPLQVT